MSIAEKVREHLAALPANVLLVAATKTRTTDEIAEALDAGIRACGENYVQEAEEKIPILGSRAEWHCIGHLQSNKIRKAVPLFDWIETIDSFAAAAEVEKRCAEIGKSMDILLEINIAEEAQKHGLMPVDAGRVADEILKAGFPHVRLRGYMTMGPFLDDPEGLRTYFRRARILFEEKRGGKFDQLSMGMSDSWRIGIEEGATIVRIGTGLFGARG